MSRPTTRHPERCPLETSYGTGRPTTYCRGIPYAGPSTVRSNGKGWCLDHLVEFGYVDPTTLGERVTYEGKPATIAGYPDGSYYNAMKDEGGPLILIQIDGEDRRTVVGLNDLILRGA